MITGKRASAVLLLLATFVVGAAAGRASSMWRLRAHPSGDTRDSSRRGRNGGFLTALQKELNLTPEQHDSVQAILHKWEPSMRAAWDGMRPKFDSLRALVRADIATVLNDEQKAAFRRWTARADSTARNRTREADGGR